VLAGRELVEAVPIKRPEDPIQPQHDRLQQLPQQAQT
jgi:hypothetical protein